MGAPVTTTTVDEVDYWEDDFARNLNAGDTFCYDDASGRPDLTSAIRAESVAVTETYVRIGVERDGIPGTWWLPREHRVNIGRRNADARLDRQEVSA